MKGQPESTAPTAARTRPTWASLVAAEPRLGHLLREIRAVRATGDRFCANRVWYGYANPRRGFKARMCALVGWDREHGPSELRTHRAYDVAYQTLYDALPDCRRCGCL
jgi:hypothetical protein